MRHTDQRAVAWPQPDDVMLDVDLVGVDDAIAWAAARISQARPPLDPAVIVRALTRREQVGSTGIGEGVALPHARIRGIDRPLMLFMRSRVPIDFAAPDGKPVALMLFILVPSDGDPEQHLELLAGAAKLFSAGEFRLRLALAPSVLAAQAIFARGLRR